MKAKITRGSGFGGLCRYVGRTEAQPERVGGNIDGATPAEWTAELSATRQVRDVRRPVWHCSLTLPAGEHLTAEKWERVAWDFMEQMGFATQPWVAVRHSNTDHEHIHIVASRIGLDGSLWAGKYDVHKAIQATQRLEQAHNLTRTKGLGPRERGKYRRGKGRGPAPAKPLDSGLDLHEAARTGRLDEVLPRINEHSLVLEDDDGRTVAEVAELHGHADQIPAALRAATIRDAIKTDLRRREIREKIRDDLRSQDKGRRR